MMNVWLNCLFNDFGSPSPQEVIVPLYSLNSIFNSAINLSSQKINSTFNTEIDSALSSPNHPLLYLLSKKQFSKRPNRKI